MQGRSRMAAGSIAVSLLWILPVTVRADDSGFTGGEMPFGGLRGRRRGYL